MKRWGIFLGILCLALPVGLFAGDPAFWIRYAASHLHLDLPDDGLARPRAIVVGVDQPLPASPLAEGANLRLQTLLRSTGMRAAVVLQNGSVVFETYANETMREEPLDGAALTRLLPILMTGALLADGTLPGYDANIGEWLDDFAKPPRDAITIAHLLTMSSGLETPRLKLAPFSSATQFLLGTDIAAALAALPLRDTPGDVRRDNQADPQLLVQLTARARGEDFAALFARRLWSPLGGGEASFALDRRGGTVLGHCCFRARAIDWARLANVFVARGRVGALLIVPAQFLEDMAKPSPDPRFGMGVRRIGEGNAALPPDTIAVDGGTGQFLFAIPSRGLAIAMFGTVIDETAQIALLQNLLRLLAAP